MAKIKYLFVFIIACFLILPVAIKFRENRAFLKLQGDIVYEEKPVLTINSWFDGTFQNGAQKFAEEKLGLRNLFIRSKNQIYFSLFKEASARDVIVGKANYLYEKTYIDEYCGLNFIGEKKIQGLFEKINAIQTVLKGNNKKLLFVIAPSKASYFPEYIPDLFLQKKKEKTNYAEYINQFEKFGVSYLNMSSWFIKMKTQSKYPLYSKTGIHWSNYGQYLFLDSLSAYLNTENIPCSKVSVHKMEISNKLKYYDDDIEQGMNLLFPIKNEQFAYPHLLFEKRKEKASTLLVGDSYLWNIHERGYLKALFGKYKYLYYNEEIYSSHAIDIFKTVELDLREEIKNSNLIIILCTEANLHKQYFHFIEDLHQAVCGDPNQKNYKERLHKKMEYIRGDKEWMKVIYRKAKEQGRSVEEILKLDAEYILDLERRK